MAFTRHGNIITATGTIYQTDGIETLTLSSAAASGDLIVALAGVTSATRTITITDDRSGGSHTYTQAVTAQDAGGAPCEAWIYYTVADAAVNTVTFTLNSALASPGWAAVLVFRAGSSVDATPVGDTNSIDGFASAPSPANTGNIDTTAASSVVVGFFQPGGNETWDSPNAQDSDTNNCTDIISFSAGGAGGAAAYQILSATESGYSFNFLYSGSGNATGCLGIVEFQETAGGATEVPHLRLLLIGVG